MSTSDRRCTGAWPGAHAFQGGFSRAIGEASRSRARTSALRYIAISVGFALFGGIYEAFSHDVFSAFMAFAFAIPLFGGVLPAVIADVCHLELPSKGIVTLYGAGVMMLAVGSVMRGVLDIYGTTNAKLAIYLIVGIAMILCAVMLALIAKRRSRSAAHRSASNRERSAGGVVECVSQAPRHRFANCKDLSN
ncbi:MAG: hypothetical protein IKE61_00775 [Coriobacteriales bacterium]|nr:hypothetical protein [Coriobacteriales bacterium]